MQRVARAWAELMRRLGYGRYGAQGGDWGSAISRALAAVAPAHVVGVYLNYLPTPPPPEGVEDGLPESDLDRLAGARRYLAHQPGARVLNATRPQSVAYALTDSPVGQLAWLADVFAEWGDPSVAIPVDRLLTNVMLYRLTGTAGSSARLNRESPLAPLPCPAPVGVAVFAHDITLSIRSLAERAYKITHWSEFDQGGHFAALEAPALLAGDVRALLPRHGHTSLIRERSNSVRCPCRARGCGRRCGRRGAAARTSSRGWPLSGGRVSAGRLSPPRGRHVRRRAPGRSRRRSPC